MHIPKQETNQIWYIKKRKCYSNDISNFYKLLIKSAKSKGFQIKTIGRVQKFPIILLSKLTNKKNKYVLISSGFHGDEPAGCWAVLDFLEKIKEEKMTSSPH